MEGNENASVGWEEGVIRGIKVRQIFESFDQNGDGGLDRTEMARLVMAVNPKVKFKDEQIEAILDEVFRTYGEYIAEDSGLSLEGLQRTYDDGAGDVDRDFQALGLVLKLPEGKAGRVLPVPQQGPAEVLEQAGEDGHGKGTEQAPVEEDKGGYEFLSTKKYMDELENTLARFKRGSHNQLARALDDLRNRTVHGDADVAAALEAHTAAARLLMKVGLPEEAAVSLHRAILLDPDNVRALFLLGNAYCSLGRIEEAKEVYHRSLQAGKADPEAHGTLLPQVHVNMGIAMEEGGLLMSACQHYREAAMLNPHHHRAMKLLGSALYGLGEFHAAEEALQNALYLDPDYVDAHCDLGSTLHALGEDDRAGQAFERALNLQPGHVDSLYNYAGLLRDTGHFMDAVEHYSRVLDIQPDHWQAQLNRAISLLGAGRGVEAQRELDQAYKRTNRVELYDTVKQLKRLYKENKKMSKVLEGLATEEDGEDVGQVDVGSYVVVDVEKLRSRDEDVTPPGQLALALDVRAFQRHIRLSHVYADTIRKFLEEPEGPEAGGLVKERMVPKAEVEQLVRNMLPPDLPAETFQQAMRALNEKVLVAVENSGVIDLGLFLAMVAVLCMGDSSLRKSVAFEALQWRRGRPVPGGAVLRRDAEGFLKLVRQVYLPSQPELPDQPVGEGEQEQDAFVEEFGAMLEEHFPILPWMLKLENHDRTRHLGMSCAVCRYAIVGLRFRETYAKFDLCATCYSECKVPAKYQKYKSFTFGEYVSGTDKVRSSLGLYGRSLNRIATKSRTSTNPSQVQAAPTIGPAPGELAVPPPPPEVTVE